MSVALSRPKAGKSETCCPLNARLAQWIERMASDHEVRGSSPLAGTTQFEVQTDFLYLLACLTHGRSMGRSRPLGLRGGSDSPSSPSQRRPYWSGMPPHPQ